MPIVINGSTGVSGTDGSAGTPAVQGTDGNTGMFFPAADQIAFAEGGVEAMRLDALGRVGIGTSSPDTRLTIQDAGAGQISLKDSGGTTQVYITTSAAIGTAPTNALRIRGDAGIALGAVGQLAMLIDTSQNVLVGSTSNPPSSRLLVNTSSAQNAICAQSNSSGMTHFLVSTTLSSAGGSDAFAAYDASGISARITTNGFYQSRPNSYGSTSDIKLKENVVDASPKLADLMRVRVRNYNYKDDPNLKQLGVIAQELEPVFPGLVYETQDRDADGTDLGTTTKNVKYSVFVPMLIKALQEQQVQIEELKARVAALEATP